MSEISGPRQPRVRLAGPAGSFWAGVWMASLLSTGCATLSTESYMLSNPSTITNAKVDDEVKANNLVLDGAGQPVQLEVSDQGGQQLPPSELNKVSLPMYRIEPPDILLIQEVRMAPKSPYYIQPLDLVAIVASGTLPEEPIAGQFQVEPNGTVNLGPSYGSVRIAGMTPEEASQAIQTQLERQELTLPRVSLSLLRISGQQAILGEHLVGPDGYVNLGKFGSVYVTGLTVGEARDKIEELLSETLEDPVVSLSVFAYNSKFFYIIMQGAGFGDNVFRIPVTGNETVLDAMAQIQGVQRISDTKKIWIARPAPHDANCQQILPVDWAAISKGGSTATNYQLLPRDRLYIGEDRLVALEQVVVKVTAPFERIFGFTLLGSQTIQNLQRFPEGFRQGSF